MPIRARVIALTIAAITAAVPTGLALAQVGPVLVEQTDGPRLHWDISAARGVRSSDRKARIFRVEGLRMVDRSGKVLWKAKLPKRFQSYDVSMDAVARGTHEKSPWLLWPIEDAVTGVAQFDDAIVITDRAGILVLDARSGQTLADWHDEAGADGGRPLAFDTARFTFGRGGISACGGRAAKSKVLARCGEELIYFNGRTAALLSLTRPVEPATARYEYDRHFRRGTDPFQFGAILPVGDGELVIQGAIAH